MNIYIFEYENDITDNWHNGGGLAIVAKDTEQAQGLMDKERNREKKLDFEKAIIYPLKGKHEPRIFIFPDAGCC